MQKKRITEDEKQELRDLLEREITRRASHKQEAKGILWLPLMALIVSILPFAPFLTIPFADGLGPWIWFSGFYYFPFTAAPLGMIGLSLAITAIVKRGPRDKAGKVMTTLAIIYNRTWLIRTRIASNEPMGPRHRRVGWLGELRRLQRRKS
jgi:hypothetical protein